MRVFFIIFILAMLLGSCASSKKTVNEETKTKASARYDESFDPLSLNDDDIEIKANKERQPVRQKRIEAAAVTESSDKPELPVKERDGYRVQLLATKSYEAATVAQQTAEEQFASFNYKTYISFEAPQYKVRVGDALTRSEAEEIRETARDFGYKGAFIVRSKVLVGEDK